MGLVGTSISIIPVVPGGHLPCQAITRSNGREPSPVPPGFPRPAGQRARRDGLWLPFRLPVLRFPLLSDYNDTESDNRDQGCCFELLEIELAARSARASLIRSLACWPYTARLE